MEQVIRLAGWKEVEKGCDAMGLHLGWIEMDGMDLLEGGSVLRKVCGTLG